MKPIGENKLHLVSDSFTNTSNLVFKAITLAFIILNCYTAYADTYKIHMLITAASVSIIILILFIEPLTYSKHSALNFFVNVSIALCCGLLMFSYKSYIMASIFLTNMIIIGLRQSMVKSVMMAVIYYISYAVSVKHGVQSGMGSSLYDLHMLVLFVAIAYLCHYFSSIEGEKIKHDETIVELLDENVNLSKMLGNKKIELEDTYWDMVETLIGVIEARDNFTGGHSVKVCEYSVKLAQKLEWDEDRIKKIMKASILHDIGKMGIPDNILLKPGALSGEEYCTIMNHPEIGCRILSKVKGLEDILPMILYHHERIDGTGYPYGLTGDKIPEGAKIIAIADSYDAMTSNRPYRKALLKKEAKKRLLEGADKQFDAGYVKEFIEIIDSDNVDDIRNYRYVENMKKAF